MSEGELTRRIESLEGSLRYALRRIGELEELQASHHGVENGADEVDFNTPHRNLSVDTIESGGGIIRQDVNGMQVESPNAEDTAALYFVPNLMATPVRPWVVLSGRVDEATSSTAVTLAASPAADDNAGFTFSSGADASVLTIAAARAAGDETGVSGAAIRIDTTDSGASFVRITGQFRLQGVASDYLTLADGSLWYRSDIDKFRARINGATENLATETLVTNHTADTSDAHDASAISVLDTGGNFTGTDVEAVLAELAAAGGSNMPMPPLVSSLSWHGVGSQLGTHNALSTPASAAWPTANKATYVPLVVTEDITVVKLWCFNGATASGNVNMALYTSAFAQVANSEIGSTAQSGTSVIQEFDITNVDLAAGLYYIALTLDNTTGTIQRCTITGAAEGAQTAGVFMEESVFNLPSTATPAAAADNYIPWCGISTRTLVT